MQLVDEEICLDYFVVGNMQMGIDLFLVFYFCVNREVQAAMQISQSWEESLSLVKNDSSLQFVQPPSVLLTCSVSVNPWKSAVLYLPTACFGPEPLLASLDFCREDKYKHARLTLWELTGPPVSQGQTELVV